MKTNRRLSVIVLALGLALPAFAQNASQPQTPVGDARTKPAP